MIGRRGPRGAGVGSGGVEEGEGGGGREGREGGARGSVGRVGRVVVVFAFVRGGEERGGEESESR